MSEDTPLRQLARVLWDNWERIVDAGGKQQFENEYGDVTPKNMFYRLTDDFVDDERWDAELLVGLGEQLGREYDDTSLEELCQLLGAPLGERP